MVKEETTTIRITKETKELLEKFGRFKDNYSTIIQRIIFENVDTDTLDDLGIKHPSLKK